jgi:hypothetical protein
MELYGNIVFSCFPFPEEKSPGPDNTDNRPNMALPENVCPSYLYSSLFQEQSAVQGTTGRQNMALYENIVFSLVSLSSRKFNLSGLYRQSVALPENVCTSLFLRSSYLRGDQLVWTIQADKT